jgi:hypothetical protein
VHVVKHVEHFGAIWPPNSSLMNSLRFFLISNALVLLFVLASR